MNLLYKSPPEAQSLREWLDTIERKSPMTERVCNQVPEVIILKIAEAANSWIMIRKIEKQFGDQDGAVGRDLRTAEARMRAAIADLPEPAEARARLPWDALMNRSEPYVEKVAKEIHDAWEHHPAHVRGWVAWVAGGNSQLQDHARTLARVRLRRAGYRS